MRDRMTASSLLILAMSFVVASCGPTVTATSTIPPATTTTLAPVTTTIVDTTTSTGQATTTTTEPAATTTTIATTLAIGDWGGELIDAGPRNGDRMVVVGVRFNDVLNVREGPGQEFSVVTTIEPASDDVSSLGLAWASSGSTWYAVDIAGTQGWASSGFLTLQAGTFDFTSRVTEELGGLPESGSLIDLGMTVARTLATDDPPSRIEQPTEVVVGEVGEMQVDVVGLGDDSVAGYRLHVVADNDEGTWRLTTVEATVLCTRGVDGDVCS